MTNKVHIPDDVLEKVDALLKLGWMSASDFNGCVVDSDDPKTVIEEWNRIHDETAEDCDRLSREIQELLQVCIHRAP